MSFSCLSHNRAGELQNIIKRFYVNVRAQGPAPAPDDFPLSLWEQEIVDWKLFIILTSYLYRQYFDVHSLRPYQEDKICIAT